MIRLFLSGLRFYWRSHFGVLLGTALAAAVLAGSLLVGDSVDGSLRKSALQRLGNIRHAISTPNRFFSSGLAAKVPGGAAALLQLRGMAMAGENQVNRVRVLGCGSTLWNFAGMEFQLLENEVALNQKLASALGVAVGDEVSLRIEKPGLPPGDAPLAAQKGDRTVRGRFKVARILSGDELGRFSLSANQVVPYNAFVDFQGLEERVGLEEKANLLVSAVPGFAEWSCSGFGLHFQTLEGTVQLESEAIYLDPEAERAALAVPGAQGTLTYLVNSISKGRRSTPYSFVIARSDSGLADGGIAINRWLADELDAGVGDTVSMEYFELSPANKFVERERDFRVCSIVEMEDLELERKLAPRFPGLADVDRCADWDAGIPMEADALDDAANEEYWNAFGQTPKAVVSLKAGQEMWSNRFGNLTSVRWKAGQASSLSAAFRKEYNPAAAGFVFQPVRKQALAAADNAMDFGGLFVGMSFFLIVAALLLSGLLFAFGVQSRSEEMGILLAAGWRPGAVRKVFLMEGGVVALAGAVAGAWLGTAYTRLLIFGLSNYWNGAVANSAIEYFAKPQTVATGVVAGFVCAMAAMAIAMGRMVEHPARELLMADFSQVQVSPARQAVRLRYGVGALLAAVGIVAYALLADVQGVTMPFFGAGALLLVAGILFFNGALRRMGRLESLPHMGALAMRNMTRRRGRSLAVAGLLASGVFLVFAVSSMKEDVTGHAEEPGSGTGGFAWFGESTLPIADDLGGVRLRVRGGDDASCLNLNRAH